VTPAARALPRKVLVSEAACLAGWLSSLVLLGPPIVSLDLGTVLEVVRALAPLLALSGAVTALVTRLALRRTEPTLSALGDSERARRLDPESLRTIARVPAMAVLATFVPAALATCLVLVPSLGPPALDLGRLTSLVALALTLLGAATLVLSALARDAAQNALESAPEEAMSVLLDGELEGDRLRHRVELRLVWSLTLPIALAMVGSWLVARERVRAATEVARTSTALLVARNVLAPRPADMRETAVRDVRSAARFYGFSTRLEARPTGPQPADRRRGALSVSVGGEGEQHATVEVAPESFDARPDAERAGERLLLVAVLGGTLLAALVGLWLGRELGHDLRLSARALRTMGTDDALEGTRAMGRRARFDVVRALGRALEELAGRFVIFSTAKREALRAREGAQRTRGLLFASVSHDLKSPLGGILGLAELLASEPLDDGQRESLELIRARGRELFALIETILDAARVEAGQLALLPKQGSVEALIDSAIAKARDLVGDREAPVDVVLASDVTEVPHDPIYTARALAAIIGFAIRSAGEAERGHVLVRTVPGDEPGGVRVDVEVAGGALEERDVAALFARQDAARGRGLTLGLALARSILELGGGRVEVERARGRLAMRVHLAREAPR
jgi:signal transduction histidine kinase